MATTDLAMIRDNIVWLKNMVMRYGKDRYHTQISIMQDIMSCIDEDMPEDDKQEFIISRYEMLFPPIGGLSDFCIHHDDFERRKELNQTLERVEDDLSRTISAFREDRRL